MLALSSGFGLLVSPRQQIIKLTVAHPCSFLFSPRQRTMRRSSSQVKSSAHAGPQRANPSIMMGRILREGYVLLSTEIRNRPRISRNLCLLAQVLVTMPAGKVLEHYGIKIEFVGACSMWSKYATCKQIDSREEISRIICTYAS